MRKYIFEIDIVLGLLLILAMWLSVSGCTAEQLQTVADIGQHVSQVAPALLPVATSLGWPVWAILILNVLSSVAGAVVASTKKSQ
jgi:hypothetical protein